MVLSAAEREALVHAGSVAVTIDGIACVVVRADLYGQVQPLWSNGLSHDELRAMLARSAEKSDWLEPCMDIYDDYDNNR